MPKNTETNMSLDVSRHAISLRLPMICSIRVSRLPASTCRAERTDAIRIAAATPLPETLATATPR